MIRGLLTALLAVAVVAPYSHPAICTVAGHEGDGASASVVRLNASTSHEHGAHDETCHDEMACGIAPVAVALEAGVVVPMTATAVFDLLPTVQSVAENTAPPLTPPPRA